MSLDDRYKRLKKAHRDAARKPTLRERAGGLGRLLWKLTKWSAIGSLAASLAGAGWFAWFYKTNVLDDPGEHISRSAIEAIVAQESPVLYRDGETRMGVFFATEHREYVEYDRIPQAWKDAIVAAEDQRFWSHPGVDARGIARAMKQNIEAGRLVAGGSSLTQQTAKNLYYRPDRSLQSKWRELVNALRLEAHHSKEDILEFYANQFHVSANGRGIGIAARYFFDKEVEDLTPLECAFLAGLVKGPASYDPFIGATEERRDKARARAKARTGYVLDRMLATGSLSPAEHARLKEQEIPFKKGAFRYASSVVVDEVAKRLSLAPFPELFAELGIDNPSTAGIQVVTTLDADVQREATWGLWHHLTEVGAVLEGATAADLALPAEQAPRPDPDNPPQLHDFVTATVKGAAGGGGLLLDLGGVPCVVDDSGLTRMASVLAQAEKGEPWKKARKADVDALRAALPAGTVVFASVAGEGTCDLELRPELQGGLVVLEQGAIRAMVGGNDNRDFNRAVDARRQLGSTWKPLVFHAALQLGWAPTDLLDNREGVFHFEGTWYYPRADHTPDPVVSMAWAGTRSENLASIWLLSHLLDRLDATQFAEVAELVGLAPRRGEERGAWIRRVRDDWGVISVPSRYPELAFLAAREDIAGSGELDEREALELRSLHYGRGVDAEMSRVQRERRASTRARKEAALGANYLRLNELEERCGPQVTALAGFLGEAAEAKEAPGLFGRVFGVAPKAVARPAIADVSDLQVRFVGSSLELGCGAQPGEGWLAVDDTLLETLEASPPAEIPESFDPVVGGRVRASTLAAVRRAAQRRVLVLEGGDAYDLDVLQYHPDFRQLVAMRYLATSARALGVREDLPPVLSLPLGAVDLSLEEAATVYQGMVSGQAWGFPGEQPGTFTGTPVAPAESPTLLIAEIRDRTGEVLYRATPKARPVADPVAGELVADILGNVVQHGTGRRARGAVQVEGVAVPVGGKTGTTNGFRNAAFVGVVPKSVNGVWRASEGFVIASYVGYDDNRSMRRGGLRLAGASGALPPWIRAAQGVAAAELLGESPIEGGPWTPPAHARVPVGAAGLPTAGGDRSVLVHGEGLDDDGAVQVERRVVPAPRGATPVPVADAPVASTVAEVEPELDEVWIDEFDADDVPVEEAPVDDAVPEDLPIDLPPDDIVIEDVVPRIAPE